LGKRWLRCCDDSSAPARPHHPGLFCHLTIIDKTDDIVGGSSRYPPVKIPPAARMAQQNPMAANGLWITGNVLPSSPQGFPKLAAPYASKTVSWFVGQAGNFGLLLLHFL